MRESARIKYHSGENMQVIVMNFFYYLLFGTMGGLWLSHILAEHILNWY